MAQRRALAAAWLAVVAVGGSLPILWVVGAVPWRLPTLLVERMFRGFAACAMDGGALTPFLMLCPDAGVPVGMYQLDGGLSYPLGGALIRFGVEPLAAWKISVATIVVVGTAALAGVLRRLTGSPLVAAGFVLVSALSGTPSARSWDWYWRITGSALLPLVFAAVYALYARAPHRRLGPLTLPGLALLAAVLAVALEWQYAGLFAAATAVGAVLVLASQGGWRWSARAALLVATAAGVGVVSAVMRVRMSRAGISEQMRNALRMAGENSVDVISFVVPDAQMSLIGGALHGLGLGDHLARSIVEHKQLWVAPYIGVLVLVFLVALLAANRFRLPPDPGRPRGFLLLLMLVAAASVLLAVGPVVHVAGPGSAVRDLGSPARLLYTTTPFEWIRFPRTWVYLLHVTIVLIYASLATALLRRPTRRWSPLIVVLAAVLSVDLVSPQVLNSVDDPRPSIAVAPKWTRIDSDDPAAVRFADHHRPALERALGAFDRPVVLVPWNNTWGIAGLGPHVGVPVRNVGIDRNLVQAFDAAPFTGRELRRPSTETLRRMLDSGWASAVVLLDHTGVGVPINRFDSLQLDRGDIRRRIRRDRHRHRLARDGYCVSEGSWFTVVSDCATRGVRRSDRVPRGLGHPSTDRTAGDTERAPRNRRDARRSTPSTGNGPGPG